MFNLITFEYLMILYPWTIRFQNLNIIYCKILDLISINDSCKTGMGDEWAKCAMTVRNNYHTHYCVSSSASPEHEGCWSSCCIVGKGRYWEFGENWRQSLQRRYQVPSAAHCNNTSGAPEGSSHSCTISHTLYRGRCPLKHRDRHVKANLQQFCWVFNLTHYELYQ